MKFLTSAFLVVLLAGGCDSTRGKRSGGDGGTGPGGGNGPCVNLQCQVAMCSELSSGTTLSGTVFAPNGTLPLYNAIVYIPNSPVDTFTSGVTCDRCNGTVSGDPVTSAQTDYQGNFTLTGVPSGDNIPLVIQIGKWRRQVVIPNIPSCVNTALDPALTRFAKNQSEGDIPQMAIATGGADPFECLLLKVGLDTTEFTPYTSNGRVHFYTATGFPGTDLATPAPTGDSLYGSLTKLMNYDIVILPCEGSAFDKGTATGNIVQYVNQGGRLFATHYSYDWLSYAGSPFNAVGTWDLDQAYPNDGLIGNIDQSFPKGMAFAQWLQYVNTGSTLGQFPLQQPRHDIDAVTTLAQRWISSDTSTSGGAANGIMHMTFGTPLNAPPDDAGNPSYCGKVVYSDFHVNTDALGSTGSFTFPDACAMTPMTEQEKALAFMLFDLSSCVQADNATPIL
jgi:hypothetical protein